MPRPDGPLLVLHQTPEELRPLLEERFPGLDWLFAKDEASLSDALARNPVAALSIKDSFLPGPLHRRAFHHPSLLWFQVGGSGFDHLLPLERDDLLLTNSKGVLAPFLAETALGALLALNGKLLRYRAQQRERLWQPNPFIPLRGKTLLVVGLGAIGGHLADYAKALGMRVLGIRASGKPHPAAEAIHPPEKLMALLPEADVVSLHLRLNEETRHLFGAQAFAAMKPDAILLNTARGPVVEEAALLDALRSGRLGGAYCDVFETEPLPPESPLWAEERLLITPHASDNVTDWPQRFARFFGDNLERWLKDEPLENVIPLPLA
jgi:phosphoglycerate dehydrogenase-like enzyme